MSFLDTIFRKGRMGRTITRAETAERLAPILKQHVWLNHYYRRATERLEDRRLADHLSEEQRTARNDVGKLNETILSAGHTPYSGTDIDPDAVEMPASNNGMLFHLLDAEKELLDALKGESRIEHQMRTRGLLDVFKTNSERRLKALKQATQGRRRPDDSASTRAPRMQREAAREPAGSASESEKQVVQPGKRDSGGSGDGDALAEKMAAHGKERSR